jgi:hypothetical protein
MSLSGPSEHAVDTIPGGSLGAPAEHAVDSIPASSLGGPAEHTVDPIPASALSSPSEHTVDSIPTTTFGSPADHEVDAAPGKSLGAGFDHTTDSFPGRSVGNMFDHEADGTDVPTTVQAGTISRTAPLNLRITNRSEGQIDVAWDVVTDTLLRQDDLTESLAGDVFAAGNRTVPSHVIAHKRTVLGYRLHRGDSGFFADGQTAGSGNCIADESTLTPGVTSYSDTTVSPGQTYAYVVAAILNDGF